MGIEEDDRENSDSLSILNEKEEEITPLTYDLSIYPADYTLEVLHSKWKNGEILIPSFQRSYVWKLGQASRLIESFLMGLPVPSIFFFIRSDQKYIVIDGRQRLETVFRYFEGYFVKLEQEEKSRKFRLEGINKLNRSLYKKTFQELAEDDQRKLKNAVLRVIVVKQLHPKDSDTSIYHIFERLNTGGTSLIDQEVRNSIYFGKLNNLLVDLNNYPAWRDIIGKKTPDPRLRDVQFILRYMALFHSLDEYKKPMKDFLSLFMERHKDPPASFLDVERKRFEMTCNKLIESLGKRPFNPKGPLNPSVFDSVFIAFAKHLSVGTVEMRSRYENLRANREYDKSISDATTDPDVVRRRIDIAERILFR